jgi:hypothetical protein
MKTRRLSFQLLVLAFCVTVCPLAQGDSGAGAPLSPQFAEQPFSGCTVFTVARDGGVFFGGNDDYINPDSYYWVDPGHDGTYGVIWVGTPDNVQQGVNEKGLAYDADGLPRADVHPHNERIPVSGDYNIYPVLIMHECATVSEVIAWAKTHQWHSYMHDQMHFADKTGDAVVISAGPDGEIAFTRKPSGNGFLVSTNFNVANPANNYGYPCPRYLTAQKMLGALVSRNGTLTVQDAARVLDAVHQDSGLSWTVESMVADLPNGMVYLYYFHQFDRPVALNVAAELAHPRDPGPLSQLFPDDVQREAARRYRAIQWKTERYHWLGMIWFGVTLIGLAVWFVGSRHDRRGMAFWIPVVVILGPLGALIWVLAGRRPRDNPAMTALREAAGDGMPLVLAFLVMLTAVVLVPAVQAPGPLQLLLMFGLPLLLEWVVFQGLLLTRVTGTNYVRTLLQRLPQAWAAANLGLAGITAVASPLAVGSLRASPLLALSPWMLGAWWAFAVLGALVGGLLLFIFEYWFARRGCRAWTVLARGEGAVVSPRWRQLWWWIILSCVALLGGIVCSAMLQR